MHVHVQMPLPVGWKFAVDGQGITYYYNKQLGMCTYTRPDDSPPMGPPGSHPRAGGSGVAPTALCFDGAGQPSGAAGPSGAGPSGVGPSGGGAAIGAIDARIAELEGQLVYEPNDAKKAHINGQISKLHKQRYG